MIINTSNAFHRRNIKYIYRWEGSTLSPSLIINEQFTHFCTSTYHMELLQPTDWHSDSHKSIFSMTCCLTLWTASGELQFWASPEMKKNHTFRISMTSDQLWHPHTVSTSINLSICYPFVIVYASKRCVAFIASRISHSMSVLVTKQPDHIIS